MELRDGQAEEIEAILDFAQMVLLDASNLWKAALSEQKQRLQQVLFPRGCDVFRGKLSNRRNLLAFQWNGNKGGQKKGLVALPGIEHYAATSRGSPTFVNLDKPYPNQDFTILIWGEDLAKFKPGPTSWNGKRVCATGMITSYRVSRRSWRSRQGRSRFTEKERQQNLLLTSR